MKDRCLRFPVTGRSVVPFSLTLLMGVMSSPAPLAATVVPEDQKLVVANAGQDASLEVPMGTTQAILQLDGVASYSRPGLALTYSWWMDGVEIANTVEPKVTLGLGFNVIVLYVTDTQGNFDADCVTIEIYALEPGAPAGDNGLTGTDGQLVVAVARWDQELELCPGMKTMKVQLDGSLSFGRPPNRPLIYSWWERGIKIAGNEAKVQVELGEGSHPIVLEVQDPNGAVHGDSVMVRISYGDCGPCSGTVGMILIVGLTAVGGLRMGVRRFGKRADRGMASDR